MGEVLYKNNNRQKKIYVIIGLVIAIVAVGISLFFLLNRKSNEDVLKDFYAKIEKQDYEGMYELIASQDTIKKEDFIERNKNIYEGIDVKNITIDNIEKENDILKYTVKMDTVAGQTQFENATTFTKHQIVWDSTFIFPSLKDDYKVRVSTDHASRGAILDRNGKVLAGKGEAYSVGLVRGKLNGENDYQKIAELLGLTKESIQKEMSASWIKDDSFVPLKTIASSQTQIKEQLLKIAGVKISTVSIRNYPYGEVTSHLVGYLQKITAEDLEKHKDEGYTENSYIGRSGIEAAYEKELKGKDGVEIYIVDNNGERCASIANMPKQNGQDITLTIDISLQKDLYNQFQKDKSASVAMDPSNGEILALVSTPSFSSNDFILGMSNEKWEDLNNDKDKPLYNRFKATWVPGSSMKTITAAIGLETNSIDSSKDMGAVKKWQKDTSWGSYYVTTLHAPKPNNLKNALVYSDNVYFAKIALQIGKDNLIKGYQTLKIGEKIPFELSLNQSQYTSDKFEDEIQIADSGYGQGEILMNSVQMASIYSAFVNDGHIMTPHVVKSTEISTWIKSAFSTKTVNEIKEALIDVVNDKNGTGYAIKNSQVTLAGKTGTGEIKTSQADTSGTEVGWFTVMTTNSSKPIVISTMVEDVKDRGGSSYVVKKLKTPLNNYIQ